MAGAEAVEASEVEAEQAAEAEVVVEAELSLLESVGFALLLMASITSKFL